MPVDPHLTRALTLAHQSLGLTDPNPRVGCVIVAADGRVLGEGHTQRAGGPHAEVVALRQARERGHDTVGATAYVTLEPCSHHGRTPPCADALVAAGIARVVIAIGDPNPLVRGQGVARLRAAGIAVDMADEEAARISRELNIGFFSRMVRGRPWVRMKVAASLDGLTALPDGRSQWITSDAARLDGRRWRVRAGAVLTGVGTVLADDPRLDVRGLDAPLTPVRVVLDSQARTPPHARLLEPPGQVLIVTAGADDSRRAVLQGRGAELLDLPAARDSAAAAAAIAAAGMKAAPTLPASGPSTHRPSRGIDLPALLDELGRRSVNELHVEAGATLNGALIAHGLVDEYLIYLAPKLLGRGRGMWDLPALPSLDGAPLLDIVETTLIGGDLRLLARPPGRADF
ncbi:MAG: bifunctional diaminohydroxyphosphoribosylaminopyrimidine deaminase/5-amino-6-(5-phosphoribosylamino)uracil reductase RibD [Burkholderiales bacterium]|nr:bifunctional diaminohydroxyphosphoribosylaminopyrimidine deaminase/5-amino-6-(5-phosphoribosylamino)uracil reductase RibD [Burkholderiales bacterium]